MNKNITHIIFDLGVVLYEIDSQRSIDAFRKLGIENFRELYSLKQQTLLFDELETGAITHESFAHSINTICHTSLSYEDIFKAWNALLIKMAPETVKLIKALRKNYPVYLLSNTNAIHLDAINLYMQKHFGIRELEELFDKAYYSNRIGMRKPDVKIYKYVIKDAGLPAATTLFIDDNKNNVEGSLKAGLQGVYLEPGQKPEDILSKYAILMP